MGYTHYWDEPQTDEKKWNDFLKDCKKIVEYGVEKGVLADWDGSKDLDLSNVEKDGISFNGWGNDNGDAHETCHFPAFESMGGGFTFCKTAQKPYDLYVTACLTVFHSYFGSVRSDGEAYEWSNGVHMARAELRREELSNPIPEDK